MSWATSVQGPGTGELVDQAPLESRGGVDRPTGQSEPRRSLSPDAAGDADRPPLARHQAHGHFGEAERRARIGDDPVTERGQLGTGTDAIAVDARRHPVGDGGQRAGGQPFEADGVGGSGVGEGAELAEVAPAAERGAGAPQRGRQRRVGVDQSEGFDERVPQGDVDGVVGLGPVERDGQVVAVPLQQDRLRRRGGRGRSPLVQPPCELGSGLELGVGQGFANQPVFDRGRRVRQQADAGRAGLRVPFDSRRHVVVPQVTKQRSGGVGVHRRDSPMTFFSRRAASSSAARPRRPPRISSLSWPRVGATQRWWSGTPAENDMGQPG